MDPQRFVFICLFVVLIDFFFFFFHEVRMESCTESISYIQVSSSIIKDQIGVLSVLVSQPTLEGHLVAAHGKAWPCNEAFSGCCCHSDWSVLTLLYTVVF